MQELGGVKMVVRGPIKVLGQVLGVEAIKVEVGTSVDSAPPV